VVVVTGAVVVVVAGAEVVVVSCADAAVATTPHMIGAAATATRSTVASL